MIGKSVKRILFKRVLPAVLAASMIIGVAEWRNLRYTRANAATSLPGIENLLSKLIDASGSYKILEMVPKDDSGIFGYYIAGQEAVNFEDTLKSKDTMNARTQWAQEYLKSLNDKGILSTEEDKAPLTATYSEGDTFYKEYFPWESVTTDDYSTLSLGRTETMKVNGTPQPQEGGPFSVAASSYEFVGQGRGQYVQNVTFANPIDSLSNTVDKDSFETDKNNYVFYKPVFKEVSRREVNQIDRSGDDTLIHFSGENMLPVYSLDADGNEIFDLAASQDREFKIGADYYAISGLTDVKPGSELADTDTWESLKADGWLASRIIGDNGFIEAKDGQGYFRLNFESLKYVGSGNGSYTIAGATEAADGKYSIEYDSIRYQGGYTNNNWFLRHILDCDDTKDLSSLSSKISVECVTSDSLPADLSGYGLVVVSHGLEEKNGVNLSDANRTALNDYASRKGAVLLDLAADSNNELLNGLGVGAVTDAAKNPDGLVVKSVFAFRGVKGDRERLATSKLTEKYNDAEYQTEGTSFYEVSKSISDENFLRRQKNRNTTDLLSENVSMASCIRYIISYNMSSVRNSKTKVRILDIEPDDTSAIVQNNKLKTDIRNQWFGKSNFNGDNDVEVTTMSTRQLIGKTEDISEKYDLVYIGDGTNPNPDYRDNDMDGLIYYNIGDKTTLPQTVNLNDNKKGVTAGMYSKDFTITRDTSNYYGRGKDYYQTDRYSGNDITEKKQKELEAFIKAGHPVIVSDNLMSGSVINDQTIVAALKDDLDISYDNGITLTATPSYDGCGNIKSLVSYEYQWYRKQKNGNWQPVAGATSLSYTVPEDNYDDGSEYACRISAVNIAGQTYSIDPGQQPTSGSVSISYKKSTVEDTGKGSGFQRSRTEDNYKKWNAAHQQVTIDYTSGKNNLGTLTTNDSNNPGIGDSWTGWENYDVIWFCDNGGDTYKRMTDVSGKAVHFYDKTKLWEWDQLKHGRTTNIGDWWDGARIQAAAFFGDNWGGYQERGWIRLFSDVYVVHKGYDNCQKNARTANASYSISIKGGSFNKVKANKIDHYTKLYALLNENSKAENVWSSSEAKLDPATVVRHVNISTPEIVAVPYTKNGVYSDGFPAQYTEDIKEKDYLGDELTLNFKIVNSTDPSPDTTTYSAAIYFDKDGNGLFNESEMAQDVYVAGGDGSDGINYVSSMKGTLSNDDASAPTYTASVTLPEGMTGVVNWKLVITQNPDDGNTSDYMPHASVNRISYKKSGKQTINVLQINDIHHKGNDWKKYNLEIEMNDKNGTYQQTGINQYGKWFHQPQVTERYDLKIITITTDDMNNGKYDRSQPGMADKEVEKNGKTYYIKTGEKINLDAYDMIILGFHDSYGFLNRQSCHMVQAFADAGKSVLFTHDNNSHAYIPSKSEDPDYLDDKSSIYYHYYTPRVSNNDNTYSWGAFNFNTILRSVNKMDVYGITDTDNGFGGVSEWHQTLKDGVTPVTTGILASQDPDGDTSSITESDIERLKAKGYSIAYKPSNKADFDPSKVVTVPQTQGYADGFLYRFESGTDKFGKLTTTKAKQVNSGTITTYPYDLNNNPDGKIDIPTTHVQYSQLNMNSDNIVVWYTLSDNNNYKNQDCVNNYYLFSCDNIYYTGAGHSDNTSDDEVKLFINTMIAAYRQQETRPKAYFTGSAKSTNRVSSYLVSTGSKPLTAVDVLRGYIEDFTGIDTSKWDDAAFMNMRPMDSELHMTKEEIDLAAKAAAIRIANSMKDNPATIAQANAEALAYGPTVDDDATNPYIDIPQADSYIKEKYPDKKIKVKYLTDNTTIGQICLGINRVVCNDNVTSNDVSIPNLDAENVLLNEQKYYFTIRDNNSSKSKVLSAKFYMYSKTQLSKDEIDKEKYKESQEKSGDKTTGYFYDITKMLTVSPGDIPDNLKGSQIYTMKLDDGSPALKELSSKGTVTLAIEPIVKINGKTIAGDKSKVTINTAGLLTLG